MNVYIYGYSRHVADIYCEDCGENIRKTLHRNILLRDGCDFNPDDESSYDSCDFPKGPYPDGGGEADYPQHCGAGEGCLNAIKLSDGRKVGVHLENPLTTDGDDYVRKAIRNGGEVATKVWAKYYDYLVDDHRLVFDDDDLEECPADDCDYCDYRDGPCPFSNLE